MPPQVLKLNLVGGDPGQARQPPSVANSAATSVINEMVILSFGFFDPLSMPPQQGPEAVANATVFAQVALPRSAYRQWLVQSIAMLKELPDKETFGWNEIAEVVKEAKK